MKWYDFFTNLLLIQMEKALISFLFGKIVHILQNGEDYS